MLKISELFSRIRSIQTKETVVRTAIQEALKMHCGIDIPIGSIDLRSDIATFKGINQAERSAIFIKKQAILKAIQESQDLRKINDLR